MPADHELGPRGDLGDLHDREPRGVRREDRRRRCGCVEVAAACGKNPVVINDTTSAWGFVANRVYFAMIQEANRVVEEGIATREQVDALMVDCFNWPVGPYGMTRGATTGWDTHT